MPRPVFDDWLVNFVRVWCGYPSPFVGIGPVYSLGCYRNQHGLRRHCVWCVASYDSMWLAAAGGFELSDGFRGFSDCHFSELGSVAEICD
ncbi:MAG: hypothetical protein CL484_01340 [Acidobacteria bacterium]|nr:hypothetical protein [Acidobacteriota bacterium]